MATREGRGGRGGSRKDDDYEPPDNGEGQGPGNPDADPVRIHREFVERRIGGGAPPTQEAYARAVEQWHALPGAVRGPATEIVPEAGAAPEQPSTTGGTTGDEGEGRPR
ncbi:MAG: hypothetical protein ACM3ZF_13230 [Mycobacterium leprae]